MADGWQFTPIETPACNRRFVLDGCEDLPAMVGDGFVATYWRPSPEALAALNAGLPLRICVMGDRPQPLAVDTEAM